MTYEPVQRGQDRSDVITLVPVRRRAALDTLHVSERERERGLTDAYVEGITLMQTRCNESMDKNFKLRVW